jgi:hypothetical protein
VKHEKIAMVLCFIGTIKIPGFANVKKKFQWHKENLASTHNGIQFSHKKDEILSFVTTADYY